VQRSRHAAVPRWWTSAADAGACRTEGALAVKNTVVSAPWISLLGSFSCGAEHPFELPPAGERLLAFLALQRHPVARHRVAGVLWPEVPEPRALASLRSTIWKLKRNADPIVEVRDDRLGIAPSVVVDTDDFSDRSLRIIDDAPLDLRGLRTASFGAELLPDWYDDWVVFERERLRQLALHALEALSRRYLAAEQYAKAIEAAVVAVSLEPLRESAHTCLIDAHLAEGNLSEALGRFRAYTRLLEGELGVAPSDRLIDRLDEHVRRARARCDRVAAGPGDDATASRLRRDVPPSRETSREVQHHG
jgi:DNA-binding SARP family transcriptional activator